LVGALDAPVILLLGRYRLPIGRHLRDADERIFADEPIGVALIPEVRIVVRLRSGLAGSHERPKPTCGLQV
jgi:hypothetical protein